MFELSVLLFLVIHSIKNLVDSHIFILNQLEKFHYPCIHFFVYLFVFISFFQELRCVMSRYRHTLILINCILISSILRICCSLVLILTLCLLIFLLFLIFYWLLNINILLCNLLVILIANWLSQLLIYIFTALLSRFLLLSFDYFFLI